jgi:hypothetical protein
VFDLKPGEFSRIENLDRSTRALRTRLGQIGYLAKKYRLLFGPIRKLFRYRNSAGTKKIVLYDGGVELVYGDADDGKFDQIIALAPDADKNVWMEQYRETLLAGSDQGGIVAFNPAHTPTAATPKLGPFSFGTTGTGSLDATMAVSGGGLLDQVYVWRVTFDIKVGEDFFAETAGSVFLDVVNWLFEEEVVNWTAESGDDNKATFIRPSDAIVDALPDYISAVNFYRSPPLATTPTISEQNKEYGDFFYLGSVEMSVVRAASVGADIFVDDGSIALDKQIPTGLRWYPPRGRYALMHKGRLRVLNARLSANVDPPVYDQHEPNKMYSSRFFSNQEEPLSFQTAAPAGTFGPWTGEGLTGAASWRGKILLVFTPSSSNAVIGGDDFITSTIENLQNEVLSSTIGCIAPRSIVTAEGAVVWLAHDGIQLFDGRGPYPISSNEVKAYLQAIPGDMIRDAHAYYDSVDREYVLFIADPAYPGKNRFEVRYSFLTKLWTTDRRKRGVGCALETRDSDQQPRVFLGLDATARLDPELPLCSPDDNRHSG